MFFLKPQFLARFSLPCLCRLPGALPKISKSQLKIIPILEQLWEASLLFLPPFLWVFLEIFWGGFEWENPVSLEGPGSSFSLGLELEPLGILSMSGKVDCVFLFPLIFLLSLLLLPFFSFFFHYFPLSSFPIFFSPFLFFFSIFPF